MPDINTGPPTAGGVQLDDTLTDRGEAYPTTNTAVFINDIPIGPKGDFQWGYTSGLDAQVAAIGLPATVIAEIESVGTQNITVKIDAVDVGEEGTFQNLQILPRQPGDYFDDRLRIADRRFWWGRPAIVKEYNRIKRANDLVAQEQSEGGGVLLPEADFYFVEHTITRQDGTVRPWTPLEIVIDILTSPDGLGIPEEDVDITRVQAPLASAVARPIGFEGESARSALSRLFDLTGIDLYIDRDGRIILFDGFSLNAQDDLDNFLAGGLALNDRVEGSGNLAVVDLSGTRPIMVNVGSVPEYEIVFRFEELAQGTGATDTQTPPTLNLAETPEDALQQLNEGLVYVENVVQVQFVDQVQDAIPGTFVSFGDALDAFSQKYCGGNYSLSDFQKFYGENNLAVENRIFEAGSAALLPEAQQVYSSLQNAYRTIFRIPAVVTERLRQILPFRASIANEETGRRTLADYYAEVLSYKVNNSRMALGALSQEAIHTYDATGSYDEQPFKPVGPTRINLIDADNGVYQTSFEGDYRNPSKINGRIPGRPQMALLDPFLTGGDNTDTYSDQVGQYGIEGGWQCDVVMSVIPAIPNGPGRLLWQSFDPNVGNTAFPAANAANPALATVEGNGPPISVVQPYDTARVTVPTNLIDYLPDPNSVPQRLSNQVAIDELSRQSALQIYYTHADTAEGEATFKLSRRSRRMRPIGQIKNVIWTVENSGAVLIDVSAERPTGRPDITAVLPEYLLQEVFQQLSYNRTANNK